ncbi:putative F-box domain, leucine-rich repeat domain superfamily, F-box-like domain superfamily [Helianthus annuus]|nr:putative F-box domain, leucine-rich repeat domain superfamily, F-box-like domain superfamily [Helianthus annuus]
MEGYVHGKMGMNVEGDRLSSLPDDLIHKILSFCSIKDAIGTSVLSSRWEYVWTSMPYLSFSSEDFDTLPAFSKFVNHVLSGRNNLTEVYSVNLCFRGGCQRGCTST